MEAHAAELCITDVDTPKEGTGGGVIGPNLLLVLERRLPNMSVHNHGRHPAVFVEDILCCWIIQSGHADPDKAVELRVGEREARRPCPHKIRIIDPRTILP